MAAFTALPDPIANIWTNMRAALAYAQANLNLNSVSAARSLAQGVFLTLMNARNALAAAQASMALNSLYNTLSPILALPLTVSKIDRALIDNRIFAIQQAAASAAALVPTFNTAVKVLASGSPIVSDVGYLEWQMGFSFEVAPASLTLDSFLTNAQDVATAWAALAPALLAGGVGYSGLTLDYANQMAATSTAAASDLSNITISPAASLNTTWQRLVAWSAIQRLANTVSTDPTSQVAQQIAVVRLIALRAIKQFAALLTALRESPVQQQVRTVRVMQGDTLMSIAARVLGNFESWYQIAEVNGLVPPFIASVASAGVAAPGSLLYLPTSANPQVPSVVPNYAVNYLGKDIYYGPLNEDMIPWQGDFQSISGYQNLSISLGRRLQTAKGQLIFHTDFGSRIPPEIGAIASAKTAGHIGAFAVSALKSDPRVASVKNLSISVGSNYAVNISAEVVPNGLTGQTVPVNEVLQP